MSYLVSVPIEIRDQDMPQLADDEARVAALKVVRELYADPRIGDVMRERYNLRVLAGCPKVSFDREGWIGKPRFRLVFRNEPDDGAVARVTVLSIGPRKGLEAYKTAARRHGRETRIRP